MNQLDVSVLLTKWVFRYFSILAVIASFCLAVLAPTIWWGVAVAMSLGVFTVFFAIQTFLDD